MKDKIQWWQIANERMERDKIKQKDLLEPLDCSSTSISNYLRGTREPSIEFIISLARELKIPLLHMLQIDEDNKLQSVDGTHLMSAFSFIMRVIDISDYDVKLFFSIIDKMDINNIVRSARMLAESDDSSDQVTAILNIQDHTKSIVKKTKTV